MYEVQLVGTGPNNGHESDLFQNIDKNVAKQDAKNNYVSKYPKDNLDDTKYKISTTND